jgi:hypothetical protein
MVDNGGHSEREEFRGARIQILGTNMDTPEEGRIFVWTKMGWFERLEGPSGNVAFTPVADSEEELRELISWDNPQADLHELVGKNRKKVSEEFIEQSLSYLDSPEDSREEPDEDDQEYHQHGL